MSTSITPPARFRSIAVAAGVSACLLASAAGAAPSERALELVKSSIVVDTHIDVPYRLQGGWVDVAGPTADGDYDYPRARAGGLDIVFMSIYTPAEIDEQEGGHWQLANELIDSVEAIVHRAPDRHAIVTSPAEARAASEAGKIGFALGMENGSPLGDELSNVEFFFERGVRYITLAHSRANQLADSSYDVEQKNEGLSDLGRRVVAEMNRLGVMIDVSHLSDEATRQVLATTRAPVIASHSSARHFTPGWQRNISDELLKAIAENGGVVGVNYGSAFLTREANVWSQQFNFQRARKRQEFGNDEAALRAWVEAYRAEHPYPFATLEAVLQHIDHMVAVAGIDHVGIGSDYDGVGNSLPVGLKDVASYPNLVDGLLGRGYTLSAIRKILGGNFLRAWDAVEAAAER